MDVVSSMKKLLWIFIVTGRRTPLNSISMIDLAKLSCVFRDLLFELRCRWRRGHKTSAWPGYRLELHLSLTRVILRMSAPVPCIMWLNPRLSSFSLFGPVRSSLSLSSKGCLRIAFLKNFSLDSSLNFWIIGNEKKYWSISSCAFFKGMFNFHARPGASWP